MTPRLAAPFLAAVALVAGGPAVAAQLLGEVGDWTLRADRHADGTPYCWATADRRPGDRLTFLRSEVGLALVLTRRDWRLPEGDMAVDVAIDDAWRDHRRAALGPRTLVLHWAEPIAVRAALADGETLHVRASEGDLALRWSLDGGGDALEAVDRCWHARHDLVEPVT